jgi:HD-GYP domain-containing protein (c-di-GMP phosphodiesterase class II)
MGWKLPDSKQFILLSLALAIVGGGATMLSAGEAVVSSLFGFLTITLLCALHMEKRKLVRAIHGHERAKAAYEGMVGKLPIGLIATLRGQVLFINEIWARAHGEKLEEVFESIHPVDREHLLKALSICEKDLQPFTLTARANKGNGVAHYEVYGTPILNERDELRHVLLFCVDVTQIVQAKNELHRKHREVDEKNYQLNAALRQVEHSIQAMVQTMVKSVEAKDPYTAGHSERVRQYSVWIGEELGLSKYELRILDYGAIIHDVGKIGIPDQILTKPASLTPEEFETIKQHTVLGANIVADIDMFRDCVPIVLWHHERLDGSGYPDGLIGEDIPFLARLVAVADVFDAMTSNRSYRAQMTIEEAFEQMEGDVRAGKLDPIAVDALRQVVASRGVLSQIDSVREERAA